MVKLVLKVKVKSFQSIHTTEKEFQPKTRGSETTMAPKRNSFYEKI